MAKNPSVSLSVQTKDAQSEIKQLTDSLKNAKKEFELTNLEVQATGDELKVLQNQTKAYTQQLNIQSELTSKYRKSIEEAQKHHLTLSDSVKNLKEELANTVKQYGEGSKEVNKLDKELRTVEGTYTRLGKTLAKWNNDLFKSEIEERKLAVSIAMTNREISKREELAAKATAEANKPKANLFTLAPVADSSGSVNTAKNGLQDTRKDLELLNLTLAKGASETEQYKLKLLQLSEEVKAQTSYTQTLRVAIDNTSRAYNASKSGVETLKKALADAKQTYGETSKEAQHFEREIAKEQATIAKLDSQIKMWNRDLVESERAEKKLALTIEKANADLNTQQKEFKEVATNANTASGSLTGLFTIAQMILLSAAGKTLFEALIGDNATMEKNMASFEVLLGGVENAKKRMGELVNFAAVTPFELGDLVMAEKKLLAYGVAAKDTKDALQFLGDIAMGDAEKLNFISLAYGLVA